MKICWLFKVAAPSLLGATSCAGAELVQGRMQITDGKQIARGFETGGPCAEVYLQEFKAASFLWLAHD